MVYLLWLSFLVSDVFGWTEQGKAFLYINLGTRILMILAFIVIFIITGIDSGSVAEANGISFSFSISYGSIIGNYSVCNLGELLNSLV